MKLNVVITMVYQWSRLLGDTVMCNLHEKTFCCQACKPGKIHILTNLWGSCIWEDTLNTSKRMIWCCSSARQCKYKLDCLLPRDNDSTNLPSWTKLTLLLPHQGNVDTFWGVEGGVSNDPSLIQMKCVSWTPSFPGVFHRVLPYLAPLRSKSPKNIQSENWAGRSESPPQMYRVLFAELREFFITKLLILEG